MPSPIFHSAVGYGIYRIYRRRLPRPDSKQPVSRLRLLWITVGLSILPDADFVVGALLGLDRFHNTAMSSLVFGFIVACGVGGGVWLTKREGSVTWFTIALLCYESHVILDFLTYGGGVMLFWPFTTAKFASPLPLFYGLHHSQGWISISHVWTLVTELGTLLLVGLTVRIFRK